MGRLVNSLKSGVSIMVVWTFRVVSRLVVVSVTLILDLAVTSAIRWLLGLRRGQVLCVARPLAVLPWM